MRSPRHAFRAALVAAATLAFVAAPTARAQVVRNEFWQPNGPVNGLVYVNGVLYVGGAFDRVAPTIGGLAAFNATTGQIAPPLLKIAGSVEAMVADGSGGWYVGGTFGALGGQPHARLGAVDARTGAATSWQPVLSSGPILRALLVRGGTVYLGGACGSLRPRRRGRASRS